MTYLRNIKLKSFATETGGNISVIFAVMFPMILLLTFGGIDYSFRVNAVQQLEGAASSAALSAINEAHIAYVDREDVDLEALIEQTAADVFAAGTSDLISASVDEVVISPALQGNVISVDVAYSAVVESFIAPLFNLSHYPVSGVKGASISAKAFININLVFDVSGSMGIGATQADQEIIADEINCAFACHTRQSRGNSSYDTARAAGATMRIDVARDAAIGAITAIEPTLEFDDQVSFSLHKFSNERTEILSGTDENSTDFDHVRELINDEVQLDIEGTGTNLQNALKELSESIVSGNGSTQNDRVQYYVVLTDGIENSQARYYNDSPFYDGRDYYGNTIIDGRWFAHPNALVNVPTDTFARHEILHLTGTAPCEAIRDEGAHIFFIQTEYIIPTTGHINGNDEDRFGYIEDILNPTIPSRFEACTGNANNAIKANSPAEIDDAFNTLLEEISAPLRLTQ